MAHKKGNESDGSEVCLESAEERLRAICAEIMKKNPVKSPKKPLFAVGNKSKTKLRPSIIDRACPQKKLVSSTPMIQNKNKRFSSDDADMPSVINSSNEKSVVPLTDKDASIVSVSSTDRTACDVKENTRNSASKTSQLNRTKSNLSRIEQVAEKLKISQKADRIFCNKTIQTSKNVSSDGRVARQPIMLLKNIKEGQTQTGLSLERRSESPQSDSTTDTLGNIKDNMYNSVTKTINILEIDNNQNSHAPWRAPSGFLAEPSGAQAVGITNLPLSFCASGEDDTLNDTTFRPKSKKLKMKRSVFVNKKKLKDPPKSQKGMCKTATTKSKASLSYKASPVSKIPKSVHRLSKSWTRLSTSNIEKNRLSNPRKTLCESSRSSTDKKSELRQHQKSRKKSGQFTNRDPKQTKRDLPVQIANRDDFDHLLTCDNQKDKSSSYRCMTSKTQDHRHLKLGEDAQNQENSDKKLGTKKPRKSRYTLDQIKTQKLLKTVNQFCLILNDEASSDSDNTELESRCEVQCAQTKISCPPTQSDRKQKECRSEINNSKKGQVHQNVENLVEREENEIQECTYEPCEDPIVTSPEKKTGNKKQNKAANAKTKTKTNRSSTAKQGTADLSKSVSTPIKKVASARNKKRLQKTLDDLEGTKRQAENSFKRKEGLSMEADTNNLMDLEEIAPSIAEDNRTSRIRLDNRAETSSGFGTNMSDQIEEQVDSSNKRRITNKEKNLENRKKKVKAAETSRGPETSNNETQNSFQVPTSVPKKGKTGAKKGQSEVQPKSDSSPPKRSKISKAKPKKATEKKQPKSPVRRSQRERKPRRRQIQVVVASNQREYKTVQKMISKTNSYQSQNLLSTIQEDKSAHVSYKPYPSKAEKTSTSKKRVTSGKVSKQSKKSKTSKTESKIRDAAIRTLTSVHSEELPGLVNTLDWVTRYHQDLNFQPLNGMPGVGSAISNGGGMGFLSIDSGRIKKKQLAKNHDFTFLVLEGQAHVGRECEETVCSKLDSFSIPAGVYYYIKNDSDDQLLLSFSKVPKVQGI